MSRLSIFKTLQGGTPRRGTNFIMKDSAQYRILEDLNEMQREAVMHDRGPLLIIAGAGTGKTTVITRRIAHLITSKIAKPEEIIALTFTDKAAVEMEERVDLLVPYGFADVSISTFHAFGDRILRENALNLGMTPDFRVLTRPEQLIFFREHLFEIPLSYYRPLGDPVKHIEALLALFSRAKDEDVNPEEYIEYVEKLKELSSENPDNEELREKVLKQTEIARAYKTYQDLMAKAGNVDFGDQISLTLKLFRNHPGILRRYQDRFKYILVDEFQDTNYSQFQLLKLLAAKHRNITVVGDDDQSIYKFRGAAISNILGFREEYPDTRLVVLAQNYRSTQIILDTAYRLITHNNPERLEVKNNIDKRLISSMDEGAEVKHLYYDTVSSEADGISEEIEKKVRNNGLNYRDFAVLVRANRDAEPFMRALNMRGIPWRFSGNQGLYDRDEIKLLISFLRVISNIEDSISLYFLSSSELYQLDPIDLLRCSNYASRRNQSLFDIFKRIDALPELAGQISEESKERINKIIEDIENYIKISITCGTGEVLYKYITESGFLAKLSTERNLVNEEKIQNIAKFFDIIRRFGSIAVYDRVGRFVEYLDMLIEAGDDPATAEADSDADAVNILTVHKAKGLEFQMIFMVSLVAGKFPVSHKSESIELPDELIKDILPGGDFHQQEERRLFYVGMTRAKKELYLTGAKDYGGLRQRKVSPFVIEALDLPKKYMPAFKASAIEAIKRNAPRASREVELSVPIPEDEVISLSYYQVDDYLTCPLKYKFVHILRVPVMQHHAVIYGKALHDAVLEYHRRKINKIPVCEEDLITAFQASWRNEGFLTREHEEMRFEAGKKTLIKFYRDQELKGETPTFVEKNFGFILDNNRVGGRWDRIDVRNKEVVIIDFKSSEIKGQKEADKRAKENLQLSIYALAYQKMFGRIPDYVELYFLDSGLIGRTKKEEKDLEQTMQDIKTASTGIRSRNFTPKPDYMSCKYCVYSQICPSTYGSQ